MRLCEQIKEYLLRTISLLAICFYLASCASTDPDANRVVNPQSLASVGPIISLDEPIETPEENNANVDETPKLPSAASEISTENPENLKSVEAVSAVTEPKVEPASIQPSAATAKKPKVSESTKSLNKAPELAVEETEIHKPAVGAIQGRVVVVGKDQSAIEIKGSIVTLKHANGDLLQTRSQPTAHHIDMEDKTYLPRYLTVKAEDNIGFINKDKIKHNVFSSSGKNSFDLGTYGAGKQRNVTLAVEGVVKVYCNIHPEMASFVKVDTDGISTVANAKGEFSFAALEPGEYNLIVWHIRGEKTFSVQVEANKTASLIATLDTSDYEAEQRKNKFGLKYKTNTALFEDEFY